MNSCRIHQTTNHECLLVLSSNLAKAYQTCFQIYPYHYVLPWLDSGRNCGRTFSKQTIKRIK